MNSFDPLADIRGIVQTRPDVVPKTEPDEETILKLQLVGDEALKKIEKLRRRLLGRRRGADVSIGDLISEAMKRLEWTFDIEDEGGTVMYRDKQGTRFDVDFNKPKRKG